MLLHPLGTSFPMNTPSSKRVEAAHVDNNSFISTNVTNTINMPKTNINNVDNDFKLNNVNDSYDNSLSGANSYITHVANSTDNAKNTNALG